jgi:hypothetical protein
MFCTCLLITEVNELTDSELIFYKNITISVLGLSATYLYDDADDPHHFHSPLATL